MKSIWLMSATLFACGSNEAPVMQTTVTSSGMSVDIDHAVAMLADERCNRQLSCGNIGKGHRWRDRHACEDFVEPKVHEMVGASCTAIDATLLQQCINALRDLKCADAFDIPIACQAPRLCR